MTHLLKLKYGFWLVEAHSANPSLSEQVSNIKVSNFRLLIDVHHRIIRSYVQYLRSFMVEHDRLKDLKIVNSKEPRSMNFDWKKTLTRLNDGSSSIIWTTFHSIYFTIWPSRSWNFFSDSYSRPKITDQAISAWKWSQTIV